jgi:type II secretory pathway component PulC
LVTLTGKSALAGDVNNDGAIDISDAIMQLRHIVGLDEIDKFDLADAFDESPVNLNTNNERLELVLNGDVNLSTQLNPLYYEII